jgi:imidazolonepropionase
MAQALSAPRPCDLLVHNCAELATPLGTSARGGAALGRIHVQPHAAVAIVGDRIAEVGAERDLESRWSPRARLDARGGLLVPGFVDAHSHPVFVGTREEEFELRTRGATYVEIAQQGGGILSSVRGVRAASEEQLLVLLEQRLERFLAHGTTTLEAKSGYGLTLDDELKSLRVLAQAKQRQPVELVSTFLGAHDYPLEYRERKSAYVDLVVHEMLPAVAESRLAQGVDVFVESHVFDVEAGRRILLKARELGLVRRLHADQLSLSGGARLAAEVGAASADHLEFVDDAGAEALLAAGVVPVLAPLVPLYLRQDREAPGRSLIDRGLPVAITTDYNPGSCYCLNMQEALAFAALRYRMSAAECLTAGTLNGACALGLGATHGSLEAGKQADLVVLDMPNHRRLVYELGGNAVRAVVKRGIVVRDAGKAVGT